MRYLILIAALLFMHSSLCNAQQNGGKTNTTGRTNRPVRNNTKHALEPIKPNTESNIQGDGYLIYKNTMIRGKITLGKNFINLERKINDTENFVTNMYLTDTALKLVTIYKPGKTPLCLNRIRNTDKAMMRLVHEGKVNIFDDRILSFYATANVDKNKIVITMKDVPEDLSSTLPDRTKSKLIERINKAYALNYDANDMAWATLLQKIEGLDK